MTTDYKELLQQLTSIEEGRKAQEEYDARIAEFVSKDDVLQQLQAKIRLGNRMKSNVDRYLDGKKATIKLAKDFNDRQHKSSTMASQVYNVIENSSKPLTIDDVCKLLPHFQCKAITTALAHLKCNGAIERISCGTYCKKQKEQLFIYPESKRED